MKVFEDCVAIMDIPGKEPTMELLEDLIVHMEMAAGELRNRCRKVETTPPSIPGGRTIPDHCIHKQPADDALYWSLQADLDDLRTVVSVQQRRIERLLGYLWPVKGTLPEDLLTSLPEAVE